MGVTLLYYFLRVLRLVWGLGLPAALLVGLAPMVGVEVSRPSLRGELLLVGERLLGLPLTGEARPTNTFHMILFNILLHYYSW